MEQKDDFFVQVTLTPEQARIVCDALDLLARIHIGQFNIVREQFIVDRPKELDDLLFKARQICFPELGGPGHSHGISGCPTEKGKVAWDIQQVIRHTEAWARCPEGGMSVNFHDPMFVSKSVPRPKAKTLNVLDRLADL